MGVFDGRKLFGFDGMFSTATWVAGRVGVHRAGVSAMVKVARQVRAMPLTMAAMRAGALSFDKVRCLAAAHGVSEKTAVDYEANEADIVATVGGYSVEQTAMFTALWAAASDPDAEDAKHKDRDKARRVNLSRSLEGMGFLDGLLTTEAAAIVNGQSTAAGGSPENPPTGSTETVRDLAGWCHGPRRALTGRQIASAGCLST